MFNVNSLTLAGTAGRSKGTHLEIYVGPALDGLFVRLLDGDDALLAKAALSIERDEYRVQRAEVWSDKVSGKASATIYSLLSDEQAIRLYKKGCAIVRSGE